MKYLLPILFFCTIYCLSVKAQDTLKNGRPKPRLPTLKDFLHPEVIRRRQAHDDSLYAANHPEKKHPTIYLDFGLGGSTVGFTGLQGNASLNYQYERSLFTVRIADVAPFNINFISNSYYYNPYDADFNVTEYALLYGWRFTNHEHFAVSFSAGVSTNEYSYNHYVYQTPKEKFSSYYAGIPFEANAQFYLRGFGPSFGLKLSGDISKHGFFGFGVDMGLGFHNTPKQ